MPKLENVPEFARKLGLVLAKKLGNDSKASFDLWG